MMSWAGAGGPTPGRSVLVSGKSQSGKTTAAQQYGQILLRRGVCGGRAIAWDADAQWCRLPGWRKVTSQRELLEAVQKPGAARIAYVVPKLTDEERLKREFQFWCGCVMYWAEHRGPCLSFFEELADVSGSGKAYGLHGVLLRRGLKLGIWMFQIVQSWAEATKTATKNANEYIVLMGSVEDCEYLHRKTRIPLEDLEGLERFEYLHLNVDTKELIRGKLPFAIKKSRK